MSVSSEKYGYTYLSTHMGDFITIRTSVVLQLIHLKTQKLCVLRL